MDDTFRVGSWVVQPSLNTVSLNGTVVRVEPKVMGVLVCLTSPGEIFFKETILKVVWKDTFHSDDVLTRSISELRRIFQDDAREPRIIQTIPKGGYRLVAEFNRLAAAGEQSALEPTTPGRPSGSKRRFITILAGR